MTYGQPFTPADVGQVMPGSAAEAGGIRAGDAIVSIDGRAIERFEDVQQIVRLNPAVPMTMVGIPDCSIKSERIRAVDVLPFVPVTAANRSRRSGWP